MYNLLVPIAGRGTRIAEGGYTIPKPLVPAGNKQILDWSLESIDRSNCRLIFGILREQAYNFSLDTILRQKYPDCGVVIIDKPTRGAVETCLMAEELIDNAVPLVIFCPDVAFSPKYLPQRADFKTDGFLVTFKANSTNYSYVLKDSGYVIQTQEKVIISQDAAVGVYCFKTGSIFVKYAKQMLLTEKSEYYICPLYNLLIAGGLKVASREIDTIYIMGTAPELDFFNRVIFPYLKGPTEFVLCADHSGYEAKEVFKKLLLDRGLSILDCGCFTDRDCDYYDFLYMAQKRLLSSSGGFGVGFCRSGQGMNIAANKIQGLRSALVIDDQFARLAIRHNAANFFSIPAGHVTEDMMHKIIDQLLTARFQGGRHQNRLQKIGE